MGLHVYDNQDCSAWARLAVAHGSSSLLLPCNCRVAWAIEGKGWLVTVMPTSDVKTSVPNCNPWTLNPGYVGGGVCHLLRVRPRYLLTP
jgi:hypothetical protein